MSIFRTSVITLIIFSLATVAVAQSKTKSGIYESYLKGSDVPAPPAASPEIDPSKVKFVRRIETGYFQGNCSKGFGDTIDFYITGVVAWEVDLSDDPTAQQILQMGFTFGREQCPPDGKRNTRGELYGRTVSVRLYSGDLAKLEEPDVPGRDWDDDRTNWVRDIVSGSWSDSKPELILGYRNRPKARKQTQAYDAQEATKREAALEQQRQAEQLRRSQIAARLAAFVKANRVRHFVGGSQFAANPFVYEGQVVGMSCTFVRMNSARQGVFSTGNYSFVVSGIPTARFTRPGSLVLLAGRVLGNIEAKPGPTLVPHLSFVGSVFCQQWNCSDYIASN